MTLRELRPADHGPAWDLWSLTPGVVADATDSPAGLTAFLTRNPGLSWGVWDGGRLVATVLGGWDGRRGYLYHLAVAPEARGRGYAALVMDRALSGLKAHGVNKVHVFVLNDNGTGRAFWDAAARRGWRRRHDLLIYTRDF